LPITVWVRRGQANGSKSSFLWEDVNSTIAIKCLWREQEEIQGTPTTNLQCLIESITKFWQIKILSTTNPRSLLLVEAIIIAKTTFASMQLASRGWAKIKLFCSIIS